MKDYYVISFLIAVFSFIFIIPCQEAAAGGGQAYPNGAEAFMVGAMPPPGITMINYGYYGHAGKLKDDHGDDTKLLDSADVGGDIIRLIWIRPAYLSIITISSRWKLPTW